MNGKRKSIDRDIELGLIHLAPSDLASLKGSNLSSFRLRLSLPTATAHPGVGNARYFYDILGKSIACLAETLPAEIAQAARARECSGTLEAAGQEILEKLKASPDLLAFTNSQAAP